MGTLELKCLKTGESSLDGQNHILPAGTRLDAMSHAGAHIDLAPLATARSSVLTLC